MKAVVLTDIGKASVCEVNTPSPGPRELLIKVLACGICGTDRHIFHGEYSAHFPLIIGHEFGGVISEVGPQSSFKVGEIVSVDPNIVCGDCAHCRASRFAHCRNLQALGVTLNGGFAEYALVPESQAYLVPQQFTPLHLGFVEPLACSIRGLDLAELKGGEKVVVFGGGSMGMLVLQLCKLAGASEIVLVTRQKARREVAIQLGATKTVDPKTENVTEILRDYDVAFEVAGTIETFEQSCAVVREAGTVIILGLAPAHEKVNFSVQDIVVRGLRVVGSYLNPSTQARAVELLANDKMDLDSLISRVVTLDELPNILKSEPGYGDIKYIVAAT